MKIFEVTAQGFDASTDETDDRVFWVKAENEAEVLAAITDTGAEFWNEIDVHSGVDFALPADTEKLRDALMGFATA